MGFLHGGVGDRATVDVRVDQQDLPPAAAAWKASLVEAFSQLVCDKRRPRPKPGAVTAAKGTPPAEAGGGDGREGLVKMGVRR